MNEEIFSDIEDILRGKTGKNLEIGIISAENEMGRELSDVVNNQRNEKLYKDLNNVPGSSIYRIQGNFEGVSENSFLVIRVSLGKLKELAGKYKQKAFIYGAGREDDMSFHYMEVNNEKDSDNFEYKSVQIRKTFIYKPKAKENYSSYKGIKFVIPFFDNNYNDMEWEDLSPHEKGERIENNNDKYDIEESSLSKVRKIISKELNKFKPIKQSISKFNESYISRISKIVESLKIEEDKIEIKVKHEDLLEVPRNRKFWNLSLNHYKKLINKKGYNRVIRALNNVEIWNRKENPAMSKRASEIMIKLKKEYRLKEEK